MRGWTGARGRPSEILAGAGRTAGAGAGLGSLRRPGIGYLPGSGAPSRAPPMVPPNSSHLSVAERVEPTANGHRPVRLGPEEPPVLLTVISTEEEFEWGAPFRGATPSR